MAQTKLLLDRLQLFSFFLYSSCLGCSEQLHQTIDLVPPASIVVADATLLTASVPPGMSVTRKLLLRSQFTTQLTNLKSVSSCGCTSAELEKDTLAPGDTTFLNYVFDAGAAAKSQNVRIRLFSPDIPSASFMIDMRFNTDLRRSDLQVAATPKNIYFDKRCQEKHEYRFAVTFGEGVPRDRVKVNTSADFISANLQGPLLRVTLKSPPVGKIDEYVTVSFSFPRAKDAYSLKIPINGHIFPPMNATPKFISFGEVPRGGGMAGEVLLEATDYQQDKPEVVLKGDWKIQSLEQVAEREWKLRVCLKTLEGNDLRYGRILVKGIWQGEPIKIPLTGNFERKSSVP